MSDTNERIRYHLTLDGWAATEPVAVFADEHGPDLCMRAARSRGAEERSERGLTALAVLVGEVTR